MITCVYVSTESVVLVYLIVRTNLKPDHYFNLMGDIFQIDLWPATCSLYGTVDFYQYHAFDSHIVT